MFFTVLIIVFSTITFTSCDNNQIDNRAETPNLSRKTELEKVDIIVNDKDWQLIARINLETINKLINADIDVDKFDFSNEAAFLGILGKTKTEYLADYRKINDASKRLIAKYNIKNEVGNSCISCKTTNEETISKIKRTVTLLKKNKQNLAKFRQLLGSPNLNIIAQDGGDDRCCPWRFYACVTLCASTIEAFPAYLLCCAFCFDTYCCK
jgi:hypothetical protein